MIAEKKEIEILFPNSLKGSEKKYGVVKEKEMEKKEDAALIPKKDVPRNGML